MPPGKSLLRKEIVKTLSSAIDHEMNNDDNNAYILYAESLKLVANALQLGEPDISGQISDKKYKKNLLEFASQSLNRISLILNKGEEDVSSHTHEPTAPTEKEVNVELFDTSLPCKIMEDQLVDAESRILVERYQKRIVSASSISEKQNLELELARQLVENMSIVRKKFLEASSFAMHSGDRIFQVQEKLANGTLRESDLKKQQLYGLSFQYHQCNPVMDVSISDIRASMRSTKLIRELVMVVLDTSGHPLNYALQKMKRKVLASLSSLSNEMSSFHSIASVVKEDLNILIDTLKALFEELQADNNYCFAFRIVHEFYFKEIKHSIVHFLRKCMYDTEALLKECFISGSDEFLLEEVDEDCLNEAVTKLHYLTTLSSPYDMIDCLIQIIRLLATNQFDRNHTVSIGADDLLPRICQAVLASRLNSLHCEVEFLETFTPSDQALGEGGYAVTALSSSLKYLLKQE